MKTGLRNISCWDDDMQNIGGNKYASDEMIFVEEHGIVYKTYARTATFVQALKDGDNDMRESIVINIVM